MKRIYLNLKIALRSLVNFKLRTTLAVLGVFLGTFSLIVVSNLSDSLAKKTEQEADSFGKNLLIVRSGVVRKFGTRTRLLSKATTLTVRDAHAIINGSEFINAVSPSGNSSFPIRYRGIGLTSIFVAGVTPNYTEVRNFRVNEGIFINDNDNRTARKVAVLGSEVAETLFGKENPIGQYVLIWRVPCQVIGVMESKGVDLSGFNQDNQIFVPLNTFLRRFVNKDYINSISVQVRDEQSIPEAKSQIEHILRIKHQIKDGQNDDFTVIDMKDVMALKTETMKMISILGSVSAGAAFLIGGIGILSIMILIVHERRVEIGIRRAVGSKKKDIIIQFLLESSFISLSGGSVGVVISFVATIIIFLVTKLPFSLSPTGYIISFFASVGVGILAGIYPSKKATLIQPVDIIRS
jgi:putative ABC transport system permease protein